METDKNPFEGHELQFPLNCHFRIVAQNVPGIRESLEAVLRGLDIQSPLQEGQASAKGAYRTFNFDVEIESREAMNRIDSSLRQNPNVKMVL
ncbi:MAG TPA: DUF493 domain-containing protein [Verrucomicrobiae bacterium]|jgi:putative lipoic acid-binding regulatory protein|nr:DUF493 domain-containing protein [Verrucomicrobiae bacterium]